MGLNETSFACLIAIIKKKVKFVPEIFFITVIYLINVMVLKVIEILNKCFQIELIRRDYTANGGWETFLSYEDPEQDILVGLLRLRKCSEDTFRYFYF